MNKLNLAILGAGSIAGHMADTVSRTEFVRGYAVASRDLSRAEALRARYGFVRAYGSYEEMLADSAVDLVYIATPHALHAAQMKQCIAAGKNILCEKPFTINAREAREIFALAGAKGVFAAEAIWTRYMPMAKTIAEFAASGRIGRILAVTSNLGYPVWQRERVRARALGGGALLDVGIYNLTLASLVLGDGVTAVRAVPELDPDEHTDRYETVQLQYRSGAQASLFSSCVCATDRTAALYGETGYALIGNVNNFESLRVCDGSHTAVETIAAPPQVTGFEYELAACAEAIRSGSPEPAAAPHAVTVRMMELMDRIRAEMGVSYPNDGCSGSHSQNRNMKRVF